MLVLASQSPRRKEILQRAGIPFEVRVAPVVEEHRPDEQPSEYVRRLAHSKANAVQRRACEIILGADTTVVVDQHILEKPAGDADAARMLRMLSGREHTVVTGICLLHDNGVIVDEAVTRVRFVTLSEDEIRTYVASGEPHDKAGAYAIQGLASRFIDRIEGCYFNVVGLPIALVWQHLKTIAGPFRY
jgi:septum formation protein